MEDSTYIYNEQSLKVDMNSATVHSLVTKGQITHSNSNIFCNGENVRMPDGSLIENMVLVEHLIFKVHKVDLINDDGAIILPSEQVLLGPAILRMLITSLLHMFGLLLTTHLAISYTLEIMNF